MSIRVDSWFYCIVPAQALSTTACIRLISASAKAHRLHRGGTSPATAAQQMLTKALLPAIQGVLESIRLRKPVDQVVGGILETACSLARASHGSFVRVDHDARTVRIAQVFGVDWTEEKQECRLAFGEGLTGRVAMTGQPVLCRDTSADPDYFPLFDYVRSELVVPVVVNEKVWGVINIDGPTPNAFNDTTLLLLTVFAELTAFAITLRLEVDEQDKLYSKLLQSEKLASLGEALAGIAHEINNPLTAILGYATLLRDELHAPLQREAITVISSEAERAGHLIRGILEFARKDTGQRRAIDAHDIVHHVSRLQKFRLLERGITLTLDDTATPVPVSVCPEQIAQVLINLVTNAVQAMPEDRADGMIVIACERDHDLARIVVRDNGDGIPPDIQTRIFDPFFTTKAPGEGTGLGLSIAHSIMNAHGGRVRLAETSSRGTTFILELPVAAAVERPGQAAAPVVREPTADSLPRRVLLVDDEPHVLQPIAKYLRSIPLELHLASSANAALEHLQTQSFDAVVTDIRMPGMDGLEFYDAACRMDSSYASRFVFMSGYLLREHVRSFFERTGLPCVEKPFSFADLQSALMPVLGAHAGTRETDGAPMQA